MDKKKVIDRLKSAVNFLNNDMPRTALIRITDAGKMLEGNAIPHPPGARKSASDRMEKV